MTSGDLAVMGGGGVSSLSSAEVEMEVVVAAAEDEATIIWQGGKLVSQPGTF